MKIKYFVRGLGMGILVTALILGLSYKSNISDEDIILRAKKLGMVFPEDVNSITPTPTAGQTSVPTSGSALETTAEPTTEPTTEPTVASEPESSAEPSTVQTESKENDISSEMPESEGKTTDKPKESKVEFSIERGDWSRIVSEKLESLGVVDNAKEFDKYLVDNGYAIKIKVGTFSIKKGADYSEIAKMITE